MDTDGQKDLLKCAEQVNMLHKAYLFSKKSKVGRSEREASVKGIPSIQCSEAKNISHTEAGINWKYNWQQI